MSLLQSTAVALPKRPLARWLAPATVAGAIFHIPLPQCRTSGAHHDRQRNLQQLRTYASRPKSVPSPSVLGSKKSSGELLFPSINYVPPLDFWGPRLDTLNPEDVTVDDCSYVAESYCKIAVKNSTTWKERLQRDYEIDNYELYTTARCLLLGGTGSDMSLGLSMLKAGSDLGYPPSTVFLVSALIAGSQQEGKRGPNARQLLTSILPRFEQIVKAGTDPDALTLKGRMLSDQAKFSDALLHLERAIKIAAQKDKAAAAATTTTAGGAATAIEDTRPPIRPPRWSTEGMCYLERGRILFLKGRKQEAEKSMMVAAYELDIERAYVELAGMLRHSNDAKKQEEREYCLLKAALSGSKSACVDLAEIENEKCTNASDPSKREGHQRMSTEWYHLGKEGDSVRI
ncbi:hypothetical protein V8F20_008755 [Naviculisporaceae sp. PSN 640]